MKRNLQLIYDMKIEGFEGGKHTANFLRIALAEKPSLFLNLFISIEL